MSTDPGADPVAGGDTFRTGDACLLVDGRGRRYLLDLSPSQTFQHRTGFVRHATLIGIPPGSVVRSSSGSRLLALRPRLADYILTMRRGAQVVYPKDIGPIIHWADIRPGDTVVEAGTGSGALTMALVRAVGPAGRVISVEARDDHLAHARTTIARFCGGIPPTLDLVAGRVEEVLPGHRPDRVVLDLPEPWEVAGAAAAALAPGGLLCSYLPTVPQVQRLHDALRHTGRFFGTETFEILIRTWTIDGRSVRPDSRMVGHTGFLTVSYHTDGLPLDAEDPAAGAGSSDGEPNA